MWNSCEVIFNWDFLFPVSPNTFSLRIREGSSLGAGLWQNVVGQVVPDISKVQGASRVSESVCPVRCYHIIQNLNLQQHCYENLKNCFTYLPRTNPHPAIPTSCPRHNKTKVHFLSNMYSFFNHLWLMGSTWTFIWNCFGLSSIQ